MTTEIPPRLAGKVEYVMALDALALSARRFADAAGRCAEIAERLDPQRCAPDDPAAVAVFVEVRESLLTAFARAPGLMQIFQR